MSLKVDACPQAHNINAHNVSRFDLFYKFDGTRRRACSLSPPQNSFEAVKLENPK